MPPVRTKKGDGPGTVRKEVEFVAKDADEQVASGIAMVPDKADLQRDFAREDTIRAFADQFDTFEEAGEAGGGIMHAVFPDEWMTLERNEVLDEAETIGGTEAPAGAWVQDWSIENDEHWGLIEDGILEGYSIGAIDVRWDGPYEQGDDPVDDVDTPEEIGDDPIWELTDGIVREVSTVDIPAVPDAQILETKADAEKRLGDYLGDQSGFLEEAQERGHSEGEAERLWDVLNAAADVEGSGEPGKQSVLERAAKQFLAVLSGSDDDSRSEAPGRAETSDEDPREDTKDADADADDDAPAGDTADDDSTDMSNDDDTPDDDGGPDPLELAEQNAEQITDLTQAVENLTESLAGPEPKTAEIEIEGETYEVREEAAKAALGVDENRSVADAIEELNEKASRVDEVEQRLDTIAQQSGGSQQLEASADGEEEDGGLEGVGKALS